MYWGIDGCKGGWIAIGLDDEEQCIAVLIENADDDKENKNTCDSDVCNSLEAFWDHYGKHAKCILIDMPIGLPSEGKERIVDGLARKQLKRRKSSVFPVPTREALRCAVEHGFADNAYSKCNIKIKGKKLSKQTWAIMPKIYELDEFLQNPKKDMQTKIDRIAEIHPEILFWALNGGNVNDDKNVKKDMEYTKKSGLGFMERLRLLEAQKDYVSNPYQIVKDIYDKFSSQLADDDIVDALVAVVCARMDNLESLPKEPPTDECGLPMRIVFPDIGKNT